MPPKRKNTIGKRERRALGIPSPVAAVADPLDIDVNVEVPPPPAAASAPDPNLSESMVMVTPEEQQQQSFNFPEPQEPSGYSLSPIAAADESMNQTDPDYVAPVELNLNSSDSSMGESPTPLIRKMLGLKKKITQKVTEKTQFASSSKVVSETQLAACANISTKKTFHR